MADDPELLERVEDALAAAGRAWSRVSCCSISRPARRCWASICRSAPASGTVERLTDAGRAGQLGLPRVADELYRSARRLRVFVASTTDVRWMGCSTSYLARRGGRAAAGRRGFTGLRRDAA